MRAFEYAIATILIGALVVLAAISLTDAISSAFAGINTQLEEAR